MLMGLFQKKREHLIMQNREQGPGTSLSKKSKIIKIRTCTVDDQLAGRGAGISPSHIFDNG